MTDAALVVRNAKEEAKMLQPKRVKYRRPHGLSYEGKAKGGTTVDFG